MTDDGWVESTADRVTAGSPLVWKILSILAGIGAAQIARRGLVIGWRKVRHDDPPLNPISRDTSWPEAIAFAAVSGTAYGVARMLAQRGAAGAWTKQLGAPPPGVESVS
jgi:hypothetical protein